MKRRHFVFFVLTLFSNAVFAQSELSVDLNLEKNVFLVGETIFAGLTITNRSNTALDIPIPSTVTHSLAFNITNASGKLVEYRGPRTPHGGTKTLKLEAGQEYFNLEQITRYHGEGYSAATPIRFLEPGEYSLQVRYKYGNKAIDSKMIKFAVKAPTGREATAYGVFTSTLRELAQGKVTVDKVERLLAIARDYPNSVYAPLALSVTAAFYKIALEDSTRARSLRMEMVEKYPSSGLVINYLSWLAKELPRDQKREFLMGVKTRSLSPLVKRQIDQMNINAEPIEK